MHAYAWHDELQAISEMITLKQMKKKEISFNAMQASWNALSISLRADKHQTHRSI